MSETMETLLNRRACRSFKADPVPKELIEKVIEAGLYAPTGMGLQSPIIVAITDKETRNKLSRANCESVGWETDSDPFYGAPVVLVVLADKKVGTHVYDGSLAMGNMLNAAYDLGLGSCWIHRAKEEFQMPEWKEFLKKIGVNGDYEGIGNLILGYKKEPEKAAAPRKAGRVFWVE